MRYLRGRYHRVIRLLLLGCLMASGMAALARPPVAAGQGPGPGHTAGRAGCWHKVRVRSGDTLSRILARRGVRHGSWQAVLRLGGRTAELTDLHPGDVIRICKAQDGRLDGLRFRPNKGHDLVVVRRNHVLQLRRSAGPSVTREVLANGYIQHSLRQSLSRAGVPPRVARQMIRIYRARFDLKRHIRPGDHFGLIYKARFRDHRRVSAGPVIAASVTVDGYRNNAYRAIGPNGRAGYYDMAGNPLLPEISRRPLDYVRISSPFSLHRMDPAVHIMRPHYGVDMAAPTGTPIRAAAAGRVKFVGWQHGYGRLVELRHFDGYTTRYAHLHGYAPGLHDGERVQRGQLIGFVGNTGESTGPHLLYEIRRNGKAHNPMTMPLPAGKPLSGASLARYRKRIRALTAKIENPLVASRSLDDWVSSPGCDRPLAPGTRLVFAPAITPSGDAGESTLCIIHRPPIPRRRALAFDGPPAARVAERMPGTRPRTGPSARPAHADHSAVGVRP